MTDRTLRALAVLAVLAVLAAGWFGWRWWDAAHDERIEAAQARDAVLGATVDALVALNTIDHRHAEGDVDKWIEVTTGGLHDNLSDDRQLQLDRAAGTKTVSTAHPVRAAVTELDPAAGTARLIAVLELTVSTGGKPAEQQRSRLTVEANRTGAGWKVSSVQAADR